MITGEQVRAARLLLGWAQWRLARAANVALKTIAKIEASEAGALANQSRMPGLQRVLETAGIEFLNDSRPGVHLREQAKHEVR